MRFAARSALVATLAVAAPAFAEPVSGTLGPYPVVMEADASLPDHTIYRPANLAAVKGKLPVVAFGNGGCVNIGSAFKTFLAEVASHGYVVAAPGPIAANDPGPGAGPPPAQSKPGQMGVTLDWAAHAIGAYRGKLDTGRLAVMGQSCGGLEAIAAGGDPRVKTVVVLNSGIIRGGIPNPDGTIRQPRGYLPASEADLPKLHTPVAYLIGGQKDQAWRGAEGDFAQIANVPVLNANIDAGHGGTWREAHGGAMGEAAIAWLNWRLKGDAKAARTFTGKDCGLCRDPRWTMKTKNMD